jgi:hypothetical protein
MMSRRRSLTSQLYRAARLSDNVSAIASGNPRRVARRAKNVIVGRVPMCGHHVKRIEESKR